jgi:hypothetical protein
VENLYGLIWIYVFLNVFSVFIIPMFVWTDNLLNKLTLFGKIMYYFILLFFLPGCLFWSIMFFLFLGIDFFIKKVCIKRE